MIYLFIIFFLTLTSIVSAIRFKSVEFSSDQNVLDEDSFDFYIEKPKKSTVYFMGKELFGWVFYSLIIGPINIEINESDYEVSKIEHIELSINNQLKTKIYEKPYKWKWRETGFGKYRIQIDAYDLSKNHIKKELTVMKIF